MGYCLMCGNIAETVNGLCRQCAEDETKRTKGHAMESNRPATFEELDLYSRRATTPMAKAMRRAIRAAMVFGARWW